MSDKITASTVESFPPSLVEKAVPVEELKRLKGVVEDFIGQNQLDPENVLFAGYDKAANKIQGSEHWQSGEKPTFYFGGLKSLEAPHDLSDDDELQGEHWVVNPLYYAINQGTLGMYSKTELEKFAGQPTETDDIEQFSTYAYDFTPEQVAEAQIAELNLRSPNTLDIPEVVILPTERPDVILRELSTEADDIAYYEAVEANRDHLSQFGDETSAHYQSLEDVRESRLRTKQEKPEERRIRLGIWDKDTFVGTINITPDDDRAEIGYWLDDHYTGNGYATIATRAVAEYARTRFPKLHADVIDGNDASAYVLQRAGFTQTAIEDGRLIFEYK